MAIIQETLTLLDHFSTPFSKYITMAQRASGATSAAQRTAMELGRSQKTAAEMALASYAEAESVSQGCQSSLDGFGQQLDELTGKMESSRQELEAMANAGKKGSREYQALENRMRSLAVSISGTNTQYSAASAKAGEAARAARSAAQTAAEASRTFASSMTAASAGAFSGKAEQVQAYVQELLSVQSQLQRANVELNVHQQMLSSVTAAQGEASSEAMDLTARLSGLASETMTLKDRQSALRSALEQAAGGSKKADAAIRQYSRTAHTAASSTNTLVSQIKRLAGAYLSLRGLKGLAGISDTMTSLSARLDLVNEKFGTTLDLQKMIQTTAQRSRTSYLDTASAVSKMALNAGSAFTGPQDVANFMEQVNKQFVIAGASAAEQRNAMIQLTQAMAAGALRGEELNSILDQAPGIARAIESYMGVAEGSIKKYAEEGKITAQVVKNAMFAAAEETNRKFASMPMTWSQILTKMQNTALQKFGPVLEKINAIANSDRFARVMSGSIEALGRLADAAVVVLDYLVTAGAFVVDNWPMIAPVVETAALAFLTYKAAVGLSAIAAGIAETAQLGLNAAILACPVNWIALGIAAVVAVIFIAVNAMNEFAGTSVSAAGVVAGVFTVMAAAVLNSSVIPMQRGFATLANFVGNVFTNPVAAVKILFYDMALNVLSYIRWIAHGIEDLLNKIPGVEVSITSSMDRWYNNVADAKQKVQDASGWKEYIKPMESIDMSAAFQKGYDFAEKMTGGTSKTKGAGNRQMNQNPAAAAVSSYIPYDGLTGIAKDVNKIAKTVSLTEEDIKSLVDLAERKHVNNINLTSQAPVITVNGQNTGNSAQDRKALADTIKDILLEQKAAGSTRSTAQV